MSERPAFFQSAIKRIHFRTAFSLFAGTAVLLLVAFFWIHIPDSHAWQLAFSFVLAAALLAGALTIYSDVIRDIRLAGIVSSRRLGVVILFGWAVVKWVMVWLAMLIDSDAASKRAGYWNSQLSASMRHVFTYERLLAWQHDLVVLLVWFVIPALLLPFVVETVSAGLGFGAWRAALRTLRSWQHWVLFAVMMLVGCELTGHLLAWRPLHSVSGELISVVMRVLFVYALDVALVLLLLAFESELLSREHACGNTVS